MSERVKLKLKYYWLKLSLWYDKLKLWWMDRKLERLEHEIAINESDLFMRGDEDE